MAIHHKYIYIHMSQHNKHTQADTTHPRATKQPSNQTTYCLA